MARTIHSRRSSEAGVAGFLGLLANAIFWLAVAVLLPLRAMVDAFPEFAPYAPWAPILFYALALWSFVRALGRLRDLAARLAVARSAHRQDRRRERSPGAARAHRAAHALRRTG